MKEEAPLYAVIMAGGGGTRLWPLSRQLRPKHLLPVCGAASMLAQTYARLQPLVPDDRLLVVTVAANQPAVRVELASLPDGNIVCEPLGRGTAPCIGLAALLIQQRDPQAIMVALPADHTIEDAAGFRSVLRAAASAAADGHLVTLGIVPTTPETGYGYIQRAERVSTACGQDIYRVARFAEKPDLPTAQSFVQSGQYYWNSGIFVWKASAILAQIERLLPELYAQLQEIEPALDTSEQARVIARVWPQVHSVSVDVGIMERADDVVVVPAAVGWSDVGSWSSVACQLPADADGNILEGEHVVIDCQDTYIRSSGRLVAAVGLRGMVVIDTGDAVLICPKERAQDVKKIVERLQKDGKGQYL